MAVRIKDGIIPYTWWIGIEITNNHVINVLLREMNNLIHVNEDRELYVDLQLDDWIEPDADFPVGVTTWRILQEDWWPQNGLILNWKTTSWDYSRLINADDWNLYVDLGDGNWILLGWSSGWITDINTKTFYIEDDQDLTTAQAAYDWYADEKDAILSYWDSIYVLVESTSSVWTTELKFRNNKLVIENWMSDSCSTQDWIVLTVDEALDEVTAIDLVSVEATPHVLATWVNYSTPYVPEYNGSPATKSYVDQWLATKQNILTPGTRITIVDDVISADISGVFVYKGNVTDPAQLPSSWNTVWDCWVSESDDIMYAWDWTQWNAIWSSWVDLSNYFNKNVDDSDDITPWSVHLFVTPQEKTYWNGKQDKLTAGENININQNNVISSPSYTWWDWINIANHVVTNTAKFDPENAGSLGQFLKKTSTGYSWANIPWWWGSSYTAWDWINISNNVITNTKPFDPTGTWQVGYVLKKTADGYIWAAESWWGSGWEWNVKLFTLSSLSDTTTAQAALDWYNTGKLPILEYDWSFGANPTQWKYFFYPVVDSTSTSTKLIFENIPSSNQYYVNTTDGYTQCKKVHVTFTISNATVTNIGIGESIESKNSFISPDVDYANLGNVFTPARDWDPATKKYVDSRNRVGTQAEYDLLTPVSWVIYNIIPSS